MQYQLQSNEFTKWHLVEYMRRAFGTQVNGSPFSVHMVRTWVKQKRIPDVYGGHKILKSERFVDLDNLEVLTVERLDREDIESVYGSLTEFKKTMQGRLAKQEKPVKKRKVRTELYYKILGQKGKTDIAVADNFRDQGIKRTQFKQKAKSKQ